MSIKWDEFKAQFPVGKVFKCEVVRHEVYGMYVSTGYSFDAIVPGTELPEVGADSVFPKIGKTIDVKVLGYREHAHQLWLTMNLDE
ncbi:S1 RNA-binding domain-containing protein [Hahella ganghwensis]|uniref:S1 RNA-binding domain-containing protein n=1 Tax=Hahella ganghwensis TaxID=286420 RepID=UPI0003760C89|nr:S1 RNA-binding domain-containing protein [Hahella ganghwensis]